MSEQRKFFGLNDLDRKMLDYLDFDNGFFVEIGANDGVTQSNTLHYELYRGWHGVLVEPSQLNYFKCRMNRSSRNSIFCAACVAFDFSDRFVPIIYSNLMSVSDLPGIDVGSGAAHAERGRQYLAPFEDVFTFGAEAQTLQSLLEVSNAPRTIDFFSLDTEGAEMHVLRGVNHDHFRFRFLLVECRSLENMRHYLEQIGYSFTAALSQHDYLFTDSSLL